MKSRKNPISITKKQRLSTVLIKRQKARGKSAGLLPFSLVVGYEKFKLIRKGFLHFQQKAYRLFQKARNHV